MRGRLGFAVDSLLIYATGGLALADVVTQYHDDPDPVEKFTNIAVGWTVGGGLQYAFTRNWSVKAEYRYTDLGTINHQPVAAWTEFKDSHVLTSHSARIGISYTFGAPAPTPLVTKY